MKNVEAGGTIPLPPCVFSVCFTCFTPFSLVVVSMECCSSIGDSVVNDVVISGDDEVVNSVVEEETDSAVVEIGDVTSEVGVSDTGDA